MKSFKKIFLLILVIVGALFFFNEKNNKELHAATLDQSIQGSEVFSTGSLYTKEASFPTQMYVKYRLKSNFYVVYDGHAHDAVKLEETYGCAPKLYSKCISHTNCDYKEGEHKIETEIRLFSGPYTNQYIYVGETVTGYMTVRKYTPAINSLVTPTISIQDEGTKLQDIELPLGWSWDEPSKIVTPDFDKKTMTEYITFSDSNVDLRNIVGAVDGKVQRRITFDVRRTVKASASNVIKNWTGSSYGITVNVEGNNDYRIEYKTASNGVYSTTNPKISSGFTNVYFKVDSNIYARCEGKASIEIVKQPTIPSGTKLTYGAKLSSISLPDGWAWDLPNTIPTVKNQTGYLAYYTGKTTGGDYSQITGYNSKTKRVEATLKVTVEAADMPSNIITTSPSAKTVTYNGELQNLINAGILASGYSSFELQYSLDGGNYSTTIPQAKNVKTGDYSISYKVVDSNGNYKDFSPSNNTIKVSIKPISLADSTITLDKISAPYTGSKITVNVTGVTVTSSGKTFNLTKGQDYTIVENTNTGTNVIPTGYYVQINGNGNFSGSKLQNWLITKATNSFANEDFSFAGWTFGSKPNASDRETQSSTFGVVTYLYSSNNGENYNLSFADITNAGEYKVKVLVYADSYNYDEISEVYTFTVSKKTVSRPSLKVNSFEYNGNIPSFTNNYVDFDANLMTVTSPQGITPQTSAYTVTVSFKDEITKNNYEWDITDGDNNSDSFNLEYFITRRVICVTLNSITEGFVYKKDDLKSLTYNILASSETGSSSKELVDGHTLDVTILYKKNGVESSPINAGEYVATISSVDVSNGTNSVKDYYEITFSSSEYDLFIAKQLIAKPSLNENSFEYDGNIPDFSDNYNNFNDELMSVTTPQESNASDTAYTVTVSFMMILQKETMSGKV